MIDYSQMKLGKKRAKKDLRTFRLASILAHAPAPLGAIDWYRGITQWGMMRNDALGDCTCAALGHFEQIVSANVVGMDEITVPDSSVEALYSQSCGYVNGDSSTDNGGVEIDVLNYVRKNGLFGVDELIAYADPAPRNITHVKQAIGLFGGVYIGLSLPVSAQSQEIWDVASGSDGEAGSWGGHAVICSRYDDKTIECITWGEIKKMTWEFWLAYCDESHALLSKNWLGQFGNMPVSMEALQKELALVTN